MALLEALKELSANVELLLELTFRDLRIRYKQSLLGVAWALLTPTLMMVISCQVFARIATAETTVPYPVFVYCGLLPWQFFANALKGSVESLTRNSRLITKTYLPREVFPLSQILSGMVDFAIASLILVVLLIWYRIPITWTVAFLPLVFLTQVLFTCGVTLLVSMANLFFRDVKYVVDVLLLPWMLATSVMYPIQMKGTLGVLASLNPMTPIIDSYRRVLLEGLAPNPWAFGYAGLVSLGLATACLAWFHDREYLFAEYV